MEAFNSVVPNLLQECLDVHTERAKAYEGIVTRDVFKTTADLYNQSTGGFLSEFDIAFIPCKVCAYVTAHSHVHTTPKCLYQDHSNAELALLERMWSQA